MHTARHLSRSSAMQLWPEAAPKRRPRQAEWSTGSPQASASCGELDWAWKPSRCLGGAAMAERPWRLVHRTAQALVLKLHEQLGTPPPPQGVWRHHFDIEEENVSKKRAAKAKRKERERT